MTNDWRDDAACRTYDPELFFPVSAENTPPGRAQYAEAKSVCVACPVRSDCLTYALAAGLDHGVFGGTTPHERRALLKRNAEQQEVEQSKATA